MLEKMNDFFNKRIDGYEEHQLNAIFDNEFYHYDTPLTTKHELQVLKEAGFSSISILAEWGATVTIKAIK